MMTSNFGQPDLSAPASNPFGAMDWAQRMLWRGLTLSGSTPDSDQRLGLIGGGLQDFAKQASQQKDDTEQQPKDLLSKTKAYLTSANQATNEARAAFLSKVNAALAGGR